MPPENHIKPPHFLKKSNSLNAASVIASGLCTTKISVSSIKSLFKMVVSQFKIDQLLVRINRIYY